ncbi:MAG: tyrosine-type recombinase/integrase [Pirellulales bacterium]
MNEAIQVYLVKRYLRKTKRNGQREHRWTLRWEDATGWHCETTGTADKTEAEARQKAKWAEVNRITPPTEKPAAAPEPVKATWKECRDALARAMEADNLRPSYVADSLLMFDGLMGMFPELKTPADMTSDLANEYKRRRAEAGVSPWTLRGDLSTLKATFGKWLGRECGLLKVNPFANVKPPRCDDPEVRIVTVAETQALYDWLSKRWNNWRLPLVYLDVLALVGWRATELASMRDQDLLADGHIRAVVATVKTRKEKISWLPADLYDDLAACQSGGWAFGRFFDELRRLLILVRKTPHHAAKVRDFAPNRIVGWFQDELQRFHSEREAQWTKEAAKAAERGQPAPQKPESFTLHDFRRTAITGLQMAGVSEKETSVIVGATPEVIRKHYKKLDQQAIAKRSIQRRLGVDRGGNPPALSFARPLRAAQKAPLDDAKKLTQTVAS